MRKSVVALVFLAVSLFANPAAAFENFLNALTPYPPGCVTYPLFLGVYYPGIPAVLADGNILINSTDEPSAVTARITVYRYGCADENRSLLMMRFEVLDDDDGIIELGEMPDLFARIGQDDIPIRASEEPNSWVDYAGGRFYVEGAVLLFVLDIPTPLSLGFDADLFLSPAMYNGGFTLLFDVQANDNDYTVPIPAYDNGLQPSSLPFSGRLSGIWVLVGAADQGIVLSFSELPNNLEQGLIFFSFYTFDQDGKNVWFVGNALFDHGDSMVEFELQLVSDGAFLGDKTATRTAAGTAKLTARHCNLLVLEYNLTDVGLGQGTVNVTRIFGAETAGYTCRSPGDTSAE